MSARASFSHDSKLVTMQLPNTVLLKDYLLDDLSSCSSNGFRSYPRRQCCTKVRYLIEIDLNKHIKLAPSHKQVLKKKSKPKPKLKMKIKLKSKSSMVMHKASTAMVNVFKKFQFSGSGTGTGTGTKPNFLRKNFSWKLSKHGFWKRRNDDVTKEFKRLNSFNESSIKHKENILYPASKVSIAKSSSNSNNNSSSNSSSSTFSTKEKENIFPLVTKVNVTTSNNSNSYSDSESNNNDNNNNSNSNSSTSSGSYFTATSKSSTTRGCSKTNVALNNVKETTTEQLAIEKMYAVNVENVDALTTVTATVTATNAKGAEKDIFSPISVIDFPCDRDNDEEEDEITSPFQHSRFYAKGCKRKLMSKVQRTKSLARLNPVRLEDRITLSESRTHWWILESSLQIQRELAAEKKAIALLHQLKATMSSHDLMESTMTERVLLDFFREKFIEGSVSNYIVLQEAKAWINGQTKDIFECQNNKLTYVKEMEKENKWLKYNKEETRKVVLELEYEVFTSLVEEMLLECYL